MLGASFEEDEEGAGGAGRRWDTLSWVLAADQMFAFPSSAWEGDFRTTGMSSARVASLPMGNVGSLK